MGINSFELYKEDAIYCRQFRAHNRGIHLDLRSTKRSKKGAKCFGTDAKLLKPQQVP
jgi:hypothetical protein